MSNNTIELTKELETTISKVIVDADGKLTIDQDIVNEIVESKGGNIEEIKKVQALVSDVTITLAEAMGKVAVDRLAESTDLKMVEGTFSVGNAKTDIRVRREKEVAVSVADRSQGTKTTYGFTEIHTSNAIVDAHRTNARKRIQGYATAKLGGGK